MTRPPRHQRRALVLHPHGRGRAACAPRPRARRLRAWLSRPLSPANRWACETFIGLAIGLSIAWIVDRIVGGPGILSIFGIGS